MGRYILAHDIGTSGDKATLYDFDGNLRSSHVLDYPTHYPKDGWVEQNADDWWKAVCKSTLALLEKEKLSAKEIACVCFSAQMMGCLPVDKTGTPLRNMLIWADTRSAAQEKYMLERVDPQEGYRITGHRLNASYTAAKLLWVRDNEPNVYKNTDKVLHVKDYIVFKMTGKIATDYSDASGTNLLDITKKCWSSELLSAFDLRADVLPELFPSTHVVGGVTGEAARLCGLLEGTPVVLGGGDGSCACVGAGVVKEGSAYNVLGSSSWISTATQEPYFDAEMRTFNWLHLDENLYTPCGTMQAAGYSYAWFMEHLGGEGELPVSQPGAKKLLFLPYLLGERSPLWDHNARGAFIGLGISTGKGDMARAISEGIAYNLRIILEILEQVYDIPEITMIGGGAKNREWLQIIADIWQKPLLVPQYLNEATSMGAAVCGGVGIGAFPDFNVASKFNKTIEVIQPNDEFRWIYERMYSLFVKAYWQLRPIFYSLGDF